MSPFLSHLGTVFSDLTAFVKAQADLACIAPQQAIHYLSE
jgi:hypothetical protein